MKKFNLNKNVIKKIIGFLDARHLGDIKTAKNLKKELKQKLGSKFENVLLKFGDPDVTDSYTKIRNAWMKLL